jgi:hypothetical protein
LICKISRVLAVITSLIVVIFIVFSITIAVSNAILYDDFKKGVYTLTDGQISPNGKWQNVYNGGGASGVEKDNDDGRNVFFIYPRTSTSSNETNATLVKSTQQFSNFKLNVNVKTEKQLRLNSPPNEWETAWVFFRYTDTFHYYAFLVKPTGIEFDKKDCDTCTDPIQGQIYLYTKDSPQLKIGSWSNWKITAIGNHITITVDGTKVIDYVDQTMSPRLSSGAIAMYNEDAYAKFDNVVITAQ